MEEKDETTRTLPVSKRQKKLLPTLINLIILQVNQDEESSQPKDDTQCQSQMPVEESSQSKKKSSKGIKYSDSTKWIGIFVKYPPNYDETIRDFQFGELVSQFEFLILDICDKLAPSGYWFAAYPMQEEANFEAITYNEHQGICDIDLSKLTFKKENWRELDSFSLDDVDGVEFTPLTKEIMKKRWSLTVSNIVDFPLGEGASDDSDADDPDFTVTKSVDHPSENVSDDSDEESE